MQMKLSEAIKIIRSKLGLSQEGLAQELHVGFIYVNRWENNYTKTNQIARHVLIKLCKSSNKSRIICITFESKINIMLFENMQFYNIRRFCYEI